MAETSIEWTDRTWNPIRGCSRVSEGCRNCYAERQAARFSDEGQPFHRFAERVSPHGGLAGALKPWRPRWTGRVELIESKLREPLSWRKPQRVFVNSMSDLFHEELPAYAIHDIFATMAVSQRHTFQVLTKRPARMREVLSPGYFPRKFREDYGPALPWPLPNVWLGVSVEDQSTADERIPLLLQTPAAVRFVSAEPLLGPLEFSDVTKRSDAVQQLGKKALAGIDWIIVGGESGPGARPCEVAWIRSIVEQCRAARVPCFAKQLGSNAGWTEPDPPVVTYRGGPRVAPPPPGCRWEPGWHRLPLRSAKGGDPSEWPEDLRVREFPKS